MTYAAEATELIEGLVWLYERGLEARPECAITRMVERVTDARDLGLVSPVPWRLLSREGERVACWAANPSPLLAVRIEDN